MNVGGFSTIFENCQNGSKTRAGVGHQLYILKGVSIAEGEREKDKGHHHPLQETEASGIYPEISCPGISSWVMQKGFAWHQSGRILKGSSRQALQKCDDPDIKWNKEDTWQVSHLKDHLFHPHTEEELYRG